MELTSVAFWCLEFGGGSYIFGNTWTHASFSLLPISWLLGLFGVCMVSSQKQHTRGGNYLNVLQIGYVLRVVSIGFRDLYIMYIFSLWGFVELCVGQM
jgi:hypothetical protein